MVLSYLLSGGMTLNLLITKDFSKMEKETKRCRYCGEEILAVAKKCKHCGEWLEEDSSASENNENDTISKLLLVKELKETTGVSLKDAKDAIDVTDGDIEAAKVYLKEKGVAVEDTPKDGSIEVDQENKIGDSNIDIPLWATIFFWIAVLGSFASAMQECGISHGGQGIWGLLVDFANWIPYWLTLALGWIGEAGLVFLLINLTKRLGKPIGFLCISLIILLAIVAYFDYMEIFYILEEEQETFQLIISLISIVCYVVIGIILICNYTNVLKGLGIVFIAYPIIAIVYGMIAANSLSLIESSPLASFVMYLSYLYTFKDSLKEATYNLKESSAYTGPILMGAGLIGAAIIAGLLVMCDSDKSTLGSSNSIDFEKYEVPDSDVTGQITESLGSQEGEELINDLEDFARSMKDCIEKGVPSTSTAGSHYAERYSGLLEIYEAAEDNMNASQQAKAQDLLSTIANLFEEWQAQDDRLMDVEYGQKATINDPDGYTNVRLKPSKDADIVTRIYDGEVFLFEPYNDKWVKVFDEEGRFIGYLSASRVHPQ